MSSAPGLIRYAARFTRSLHDAEDAYQRAMELALTRAPVVEPQRFMAWLRTVLRNEALAVTAARRREGPAADADVPDGYGEVLEDGVSLDVLAEWRERYRSIQDGLAGLSDAQRICLMLQTAGASYEQIRKITGFSLRKVERSVLEGRAGLAAWELRLASGDACAGLDEMIGRVAVAQASARERRVVSRHVRHCGTCRATLRERRESNEWLAALVPVALLGGQAMMGAPDPTPAIAWWERVGDGATVRVGTMVHMAMELPGSALAKVGAGTAAVVVAGAAALPMVVDGPRAPARAPEPVVAEATGRAAVDAASSSDGAREREASFARARRAAADALATARATKAARLRREARSRPAAAAAAHPAAHVVSAPARRTTPVTPAAAPTAPASPSPTTAEVALEFGP
jgi:RNA polymerase sigma factor (sigma-70 family)